MQINFNIGEIEVKENGCVALLKDINISLNMEPEELKDTNATTLAMMKEVYTLIQKCRM